MLDFKIHVKRGRNAKKAELHKKGRKCMLNSEIHKKKQKEKKAIRKIHMQKRSKILFQKWQKRKSKKE